MGDLHSVRYLFEHRLLPQFFYEEKDTFVGLLLHDKKVLYSIINDIFIDEKVDNPYKEEDFDVKASKITDEVFMVKIIFPKPEDEPLCYCSYLFFDEAFEKTSYFCIEKGNEYDGKNNPFVCAWSSDGAHLNYGNITPEGHEDFLKCADIHMAKYYGMKREK